MTLIEITQQMRDSAYEFSNNIILQNNQYDRMLPANVTDTRGKNLIRINRTYVGKLAELCFFQYLRREGIFVDTGDMFTIFEGQENADRSDFCLPDGRTVDIKAAVFRNHRNLVVPIDQCIHTPKDFYVGIKFCGDIGKNDYRLIGRDTFSQAIIKGYCTRRALEAQRTMNLGEFDCKALPLDRLAAIDGLIALFR